MYYANEFKYGSKIGEISTDGTAHRVLITDDYSLPYTLVFDEYNR